VQFGLHDAFITSATLNVDAASSAAGTVDLAAANGFHKVSATDVPQCDARAARP